MHKDKYLSPGTRFIFYLQTKKESKKKKQTNKNKKIT